MKGDIVKLYALADDTVDFLRKTGRRVGEATVLPPCPVLVVRAPWLWEPGAPQGTCDRYVAAFREFCKAHDAVVFFVRDGQEEITGLSELDMERHGWVRSRRARFKPGDRVVAERHGRGTVLTAEPTAGFGYVYQLRLDSGHSAGGAVPEDKLQPEEVRRE